MSRCPLFQAAYCSKKYSPLADMVRSKLTLFVLEILELMHNNMFLYNPDWVFTEITLTRTSH